MGIPTRPRVRFVLLLIVGVWPVRGFLPSAPSSISAVVPARLSSTCLHSPSFASRSKISPATAVLRAATSSATEEGNRGLETALPEPSAAELVDLEHVLNPLSHSPISPPLEAGDAEDESSVAPAVPASSVYPPFTQGKTAGHDATPVKREDMSAQKGDEGVLGEEFDAEEMMRSVVGKVAGGAKNAALSVGALPVKRSEDGRLDIDGQGLLNLCILVFSGLWAIHTIVTVDATMWRGWTLQETLMRLPWDNWDSYEVGLVEHPIITKTAINVGIYLLGDWLSQVNWGREEDVPLWEFDLKRTLRNGLIAMLFGPLVHFYYDWSDSILPPEVATNRPIKILMDQSVFFVTKCAVYIALVSLLRGDSWEEAQATVKAKLKGVVTTGWRFWPFVHIFTYFLIPPRHRVLWVNSVDLLWSSILAGMTSGTTKEDSAAGEGKEPGDTSADGGRSAVTEQPHN